MVERRDAMTDAMTVEERAQKVVENFCEDEKELRGPDGKRPVSFVAYSSRLRQRISEALRDQIEDCANIADEEAQDVPKAAETYYAEGYKAAARYIRDRIRALAGPTDRTEGKEGGR
jgi:hypothetical protein